jgi:hypothetical protein
MNSNPPDIVPGRLLTSRLYETECDLWQMQGLLICENRRQIGKGPADTALQATRFRLGLMSVCFTA